MGSQTWDHFKALTRKNLINQRRQLCGSIITLVCPGLLFLIIVWVRTLIVPTDVQDYSILYTTPAYTFIDGEELSSSTGTQTQEKVSDFIKFYGQPANVWQQQIRNFIPETCQYDDSFVAPKVAARIVGLVGAKDYDDLNPVMKSTYDYLNSLNQNRDQENQTMYLEFYETEADLQANISASTYLAPNEGICFAFSVTENAADDWSLQLYFLDQQGYGASIGSGIPSLAGEVTSASSNSPDTSAFQKWTKSGYTYIQNLIANMILRQRMGDDAMINFMMLPFPVGTSETDSFYEFFSAILPVFLILIFILPVYNTVQLIVKEKEQRTKESMRMMGMSDVSYWLSWFFFYSAQSTILITIAWACLCINCLKNSNVMYVWLFFWLFALSIFGQIVVMQALFSRSKFSGIVSAVIYFTFYIFYFPVASPTAGHGMKMAFGIVPQVAISEISVVLSNFETAGTGINSNTASIQSDNMSYNDCLWMLFAGFWVFSLLGFWLDAVLPKEFGTKKHPCFMFMPSTYSGCCSKPSDDDDDANPIQNRVSRVSDAARNSLMASQDQNMELKNLDAHNYEPVSSETRRQEEDGGYLRIEGLKKTYPNGFQAVKGLNVKMYQNQIFALLGQNGAGKTTTISMLTGLIQASEGTASCFNRDMFKESADIRKFMGICPQHDVLFDFLTPIDHLRIFYDFKGADPSNREKEIADLIRDVGLTTDQNKPAKSLSGGNKRKLSVAIALCGGSKLVLLDEPTAGMDLGARRGMWDMLKNFRRDRIIILTTHYMDEADVLGDRIGIMAQGQMMCLGTSLFLKNRFGAGYKLTMVKKTKQKNHKIVGYLKDKFGKDIEKLSEVSSEIAFQVSAKQSHTFKDFFREFDQVMAQFDIESYGISITTLEEVFLKINEEFRTNLGHSEIEGGAAKAEADEEFKEVTRETSKSSVNMLDESGVLDEENQQRAPTRLVGNSSVKDNISALIAKRFHIYKRDRVGLACEVIVPFFLVLLGCSLTKINLGQIEDPVTLTPSAYPNPQYVLFNEQFANTEFVNATNTVDSDNLTVNDFAMALPDYNTILYPYTTNASAQAGYAAFYATIAANSAINDTKLNHYAAYQFYQADYDSQVYSVGAYFNLTSSDVTAYFTQFLYESIFKVATSNPDFKFQTTIVPFPTLYTLEQRGDTTLAFQFSNTVGFCLALIPCVMVGFILKEREESLKHIQLISGMSLPAYWFSNMLADIIKVYIPIILTILISIAFGCNYDGVWILLMLFPLAIVPFSYVTTFLFTNDTKAQVLTLFLHYLTCDIMGLVIFFLQLIPKTAHAGDVLRWVFCLIPSYPVVNGIIYSSCGQQIVDAQNQIPGNTAEFKLWGWENLGGDVAVLLAHFVIDTLILVIIEMDLFQCLRGYTIREIPPRDNSVKLDDDVIAEQERVRNSRKDVIRVSDFRKAYTSLTGAPFLAVENISFGLDYGECFALLGVNGAGKSTTFKALTADAVPTEGDIRIDQFDIQKQFPQARKLIGYCPQRDAIFPLMTVEEHLYFYASIKGIPKNLHKDIVENAIVELNLSDHRTKCAGALSGGNKRKLSVGMATLGNPPIILLDEPSAGMDPEARRFMWSVVANICQRDKKSSVIITTHSMEEAEALSTKMGIMVRGGIFRCFGSSQHIKNKFGTGYEVEVKIRKVLPEDLMQIVAQVGMGDYQLNSKLTIPEFRQKARINDIDDLILSQITEFGLGSELFIEAQQHQGTVRLQNLVKYMFILRHGLQVIQLLSESFAQVELLEQCSDFFKIRVPREEKTIGVLYGLIEDTKTQFNIAEYSVNQTSLEQIFQTFANMSTADDERAAYCFRKNPMGGIQLMNPDRRSTIKKSRNSSV